MRKNKLIFTRLPFTHDNSVGGQIKNTDFVFNLSNNYIYVLYYGEDAKDPYGNEDLNHKITYYLNPEEYEPIRDDYDSNYFGINYKPNFKRVYVSTEYTYLGGNYSILKVYDSKTLNFLLTTNNDETMHLFSSDYDVSFLSTYLNEYYENISQYHSIKESEYLCQKYGDYIQSKKFIFYNTYGDDEDTNYFFISGNDIIFEKVKSFF